MHYTPPLHTQFIGHHIIHEATCASTNTLAAQRLHEEALPAGTVVIADHQYQGRGQRGHSWYSEPYKNLTFSVVIYPTFLAASQSFFLNIITTLALRQVLAAYVSNDLTIKWPNDLYFQDQKLSGILIESTVEQQHLKASVIGIGLNVNQTHFDVKGSTSLACICGRSFDLQLILAELLEALERNYSQLKTQGVEQLKSAYLEHMYWIGEPHTFQDATHRFQGAIKGIDATGRLAIELPKGNVRHYDVKEVTFVA
ncbi:MAG: biotin--[acetyl-CoA-carboxylase] ligase [Bacteroidota bacterium]